MDDLDAEAPSERHERDLVRDVVVARREDQIAALEGDRRERARVRICGAGRERDVARVTAEQFGDGGVEAIDLLDARVGRLVPADLGFECEVLGHRIDHRLRHERGARVVEVDTPSAAGRVVTKTLEVEAHPCSVWRI